jgi:hypothetical protein
MKMMLTPRTKEIWKTNGSKSKTRGKENKEAKAKCRQTKMKEERK